MITVGNIWAAVDDPSERAMIAPIVRFRRKGYIFSDAFKEGRWDGFNHLMTKDGRFPAGLLPHVLSRLALMDVRPEINDTRVRPSPCDAIAPALLTVALAGHQEEAVAAGYREGRGIIDHAVGAGKSWVVAELARRCAVPALVLVHTKDLLKQNFDVLREVLDIPGLIGWIGDGRWEPSWITVATHQSITAAARNYPDNVKALMSQVQNVLVDECQFAVAPSYQAVLKMATEAYYRFGLSATPLRSKDDETVLKVTGMIGPVVARVGPQEGIEVGRLVPAEIFLIDYGALDNGLPWPRQYEVGIVGHARRNELITEIAQHAPKPILILVQRIEHGDRLLSRMIPSGLRVSYINGADTGKRRARELDAFRAGQTDVLLSSIILDTGVNLPNIRTLILGAGGKAEHRLIQRIGRGQRKIKSKTTLLVFDMLDKGKYTGSHARRRRATYEREPAWTLHIIKQQDVLEALASSATDTNATSPPKQRSSVCRGHD